MTIPKKNSAASPSGSSKNGESSLIGEEISSVARSTFISSVTGFGPPMLTELTNSLFSESSKALNTNPSPASKIGVKPSEGSRSRPVKAAA